MHPLSLISTFVVGYLESIIPLVSISEISSLFLASVAAQAGLCLTWSQTPKTGFLMRKPVLAICEQQRCRSACASAQSDQHLCCSLLRKYNLPLVSISEISSLYLASVAAQAGLCLTGSQTPKTGFLMRKSVLALCEQQRCRSACASAQSDQNLCCSL